jgi:GTP cyclohydrolase I
LTFAGARHNAPSDCEPQKFLVFYVTSPPDQVLLAPRLNKELSHCAGSQTELLSARSSLRGRRADVAAEAAQMEDSVLGKRKDGASDGAESTLLELSGCASGTSASTPDSTPSDRLPLSPEETHDQDLDDDARSILPPAKRTKPLSYDERLRRITEAARVIIDCVDDNPHREGLLKTPGRYAKAILQLTSGRDLTPAAIVGDAHFDENHSEMVLVRNIDVFSQCEHHMLPFHGVCHVAYIPCGTVVGLSKLARIVDAYAHRLQVQERLTSQIADAILHITRARGVIVYVSCSHMCMVMRGVRKVGSETVTIAARGCYRDDKSLRQEFMLAVKQ